MKLLLILGSLFKESPFANYGRLSNSLPWIIKTIPFRGIAEIEDSKFIKKLSGWVRTSANFYEVPWLIIEPKVSHLSACETVELFWTFPQRKISEYNWITITSIIFKELIRLLKIRLSDTNNPSSRIVFVCLSLFTIQTIVLVDRVHGDADTELAKDILAPALSAEAARKRTKTRCA